MEAKQTTRPAAAARSIRHNAVIKLASELVGRLALFVLVLIAARRLGEAGFGLYNYALALGFVLAQVADLGMQLVITREIAAEDEPETSETEFLGRNSVSTALVTTALQLKLLLSLVVVALLWILTARQANGNHAGLFLLSILPLLQSFPEFTGYVFRGRQNLRVEARLLAAQRATLALAGIAVLLAGGGLLGLAISQAAVGLLFAGWGLALLRGNGWLPGWGEALALHRLGQRADQIRYLLRQSLPLGVSIFLSIAYVRLAVLLLQYMQGETAVAQFSAASRLVEPAQLIPASIMAAVFPAFTVALRRGGGEARALGRRATLLLLASGLGLAVAGWLVAPTLLPLLFGPTYAGSARVFQILGVSLIPAFVNYSLTHYLVARGQQLLMGVFTGAMLLLHAGASWYLIPRLGPIGPALSIVLAELLLTLLCAAALWRTVAPAQHLLTTDH
ncbi:oligosaccharide flippase family protein [Promineifilum sp.]|uniref:oligosaccharide flippase family protein n=1 Tax=Promineifilum sp. TaxID=2664178 RepID=UPI0035ADE647